MGNLKTFVGIVALFSSLNSQASLLMGGSPLEDTKVAESLYAPMAEILGEALGIDVSVDYSRDWQYFSKEILNSSYDILLTEPHIIAYVTSYESQLSMSALARLPGQVQHHVVVNQDNTADSLASLNTARICMLPSPNFSGVMIKKEFTNPVSQPVVREVKGSYSNVYEKFKQGRCDAAVIDDINFQRLKTAGEAIKSVYQTQASPNLGLAINQRVAPADRELIIEALQDPTVIEKLAGIFNKYSSGQGPFEEASNADYELYNILPGVVWGW